MNQGKVVQIIGAVVDVEFARESVPKIYDALTVEGTEIALPVLFATRLRQGDLGAGRHRHART
ncbi:MAG TPA: hypothetical protein VK753_11945, partial [Xanthomonadaceae bacterium]|nr:hypothetical protein [Xanthomonadaceae bacterium]